MVQNDKIQRAIKRALTFYLKLQSRSGAFPSDYGGSFFLTPMFVCISYFIKYRVNQNLKEKIKSYILSNQNPDGSFPLHTQGGGTVFSTTLSYVSLRLLGMKPTSPPLLRAKSWIEAQGGAWRIAPWGKLILAMLGLYDYRGISPILPELWLLPELFPLHPSKMWCHARMVYLPMALLYSIKARADDSPLLRQIRNELYGDLYEKLNWKAVREDVAPTDTYQRPGWPYRILTPVMGAVQLVSSIASPIRKAALNKILQTIRHEDESTNFIDIGPVNKLLNTACEYCIDKNSERFSRAKQRLKDYLWEESDGVRVQGYNSVELWNTVFIAQAISMLPPHLYQKYLKNLIEMYKFIKNNQIKDDPPDRKKFSREPSRGGWPFSHIEHGWPITDCTAEGFKTSIAIEKLQEPKSGRPLIKEEEKIDRELLKQAINFLLYMQNTDGGWATYEKRRAGGWYEKFNPSYIFADIMIDYSYVECTSSCIQALAVSLLEFPGWKQKQIIKSIKRARDFILKKQRQDGSWEGSWGVCFTYGTWFSIVGLRSSGIAPWHEAIYRAMKFLISKQNKDGGWAESWQSCPTRKYIPYPESQPVMTSWAVIALMAGAGFYHPPSALVVKSAQPHSRTDELLVRRSIGRAIQFLLNSQDSSGSWRQDVITGVFNKTCMINYDHYRYYFPIMALAMYNRAEFM